MKILVAILFIVISNFLLAQNDTLNRIDENGLKQDYWINYFENTDEVLEEGRYIDDLRQGVWKQYLNDGTLSSEITYIDDEPNGPAKTYYPNGQLAEEGFWKDDIWIGDYTTYYQNGNINYKWHFSDDGQRTGLQEYFHENGKKMISGTWKKGLEAGVVKRFNNEGQIIEEQTFNNGEIKPELTVVHKIITKIDSSKVIDKKQVVVHKDTLQNKELEYFKSTGDRKLYDTKRRLWKEGYFEEGRLIKGKVYFYNAEDSLVKTEIYNKGKLYNTIPSKN